MAPSRELFSGAQCAPYELSLTYVCLIILGEHRTPMRVKMKIDLESGDSHALAAPRKRIGAEVCEFTFRK